MPIFRNGMPNDNRNPIPLVMSVVDHNIPDNTHNRYDVTFDSDTIQTLLTSEPSIVDSWLSETLTLPRDPQLPFIVGLSIEWRRMDIQPHVRNPVATLQLCINRRCLVFQIIHTLYLPDSLSSFLSNRNHTFVGASIHRHAEKLVEDYSLRVANCMDLGFLAHNVLRDHGMAGARLRTLAQRVLGKDVEKPLGITMSDWDNELLTAEQVQYATIDAFLSFEIGRRLHSRGV